jgi:hypothetical protein
MGHAPSELLEIMVWVTEQRPPERGDIGGGGVDSAVPAAHDRQVKHVRPRRALDGQIAKRGTAREFVGAQERGIAHACGRTHPFVHQPRKRNPADALGDQRQDDVPAVAVGEAFARRELGRMPAEHGQVPLGVRKVLSGHREHVAGDLDAGLLVE